MAEIPLADLRVCARRASRRLPLKPRHDDTLDEVLLEGEERDQEGQCQSATCTVAATLVCDDTVTSTTVGATNHFETYGCFGWPVNGPDLAFEFIPLVDDTVQISLTGLTADLDLHLLENACDGAACAAYSAQIGDTAPEFIASDVTSLTPYYIVVDGYQLAEGPFTLEIACAST